MLRHFTAAFLAALLVLNAISPRVAAKPPDLPDDDPIIVSVPQPIPTPKVESVCPHRAAPPDRRALAECDLDAMPSVLDNLRVLQEAGTEINRARELAAKGNFTGAMERLDIVRTLCPGSAYARRAVEVMKELSSARIAELLISHDVFGPATVQAEMPCPAPSCEPLNRIRNVGACYMARLGSYCDEVQEVASQRAQMFSATYDCGGIGGKLDGCESASACPKCEKMHRVVVREASTGSSRFGVGVNSDSGLTGSIVLNERNFDCGKCCPGAYESACPKCEKMHEAVVKKANRKAAGVKEQVDGLLKACYFAVREGRNAKAADLARQAHALDPKRVEADPLVYKLHMLAEKGQCEECETPRESSPACPKCPTDPVEDHVSLRPALPAVDPEIVPALDHVLMKRWVGEDGLERIGVDFSSGEEECEEAKASCRPCCEMAKAFGMNCLGMFLNQPPMDSDKGYIMLGLGTKGINVYSLSRHAGMKILVQYRDGLPLVWVAADPKPTEFR